MRCACWRRKFWDLRAEKVDFIEKRALASCCAAAFRSDGKSALRRSISFLSTASTDTPLARQPAPAKRILESSARQSWRRHWLRHSLRCCQSKACAKSFGVRIVYCRCCALLHIVADSTTVMLVPLLDYSTLYILLAVSLAMATCCTAKPRASSMVQLASSESPRFRSCVSYGDRWGPRSRN